MSFGSSVPDSDTSSQKMKQFRNRVTSILLYFSGMRREMCRTWCPLMFNCYLCSFWRSH